MQEIRKSLAPTKNSVLKGQYDWLGYVGWAKMSVSDNIGTNAWTNQTYHIVDEYFVDGKFVNQSFGSK